MSACLLFARHLNIARGVARDYYLPDGDRNDLEQEAFLALWVAAEDFNGEGCFVAFANMVVRRRLTSAIKRANRYKHKVLTDSVRTMPLEEHDHVEMLTVDQFAPDARSVEDIAFQADEFRSLVKEILNLTELERTAIMRVINGDEYAADKSMDNAAQRARRKLREAA